MNEKIALLEKKLEGMKNMIPKAGASDEQIARYFSEQDAIIEDITKAVIDMHGVTTSEMESMKDTIKSLKDELKKADKSITVMDEKEAAYGIGKMLAALWTNNRQTLGEMKCCPNFGMDKWTNIKDYSWVTGKGFIRSKDALGDPIGNMESNDQYLINPVYSEILIEVAAEESCMMKLVSERRMTGPSLFLDEDEGSLVKMTWNTNYGQQIKSVTATSPSRVELKAYTLAGFISWYDEFEEDAFVDIGRRFIKKFKASYAHEFDTQCLTAKATPFTGALNAKNVNVQSISSTDGSKLSYEDFRKAEMLVPSAERAKCKWFLNDTVLNEITNIKDSNGKPLWRQPWEKMPGVIDGYEGIVCSVLPQFTDLKADTPFAVFMNPERIIHGNRKEIELKRFSDTTESLEYGQEFLRFRKRDGFLTTMAKNMAVLKTAKA
ncbi:phage major capsid protein [uncultured Treponema sp.]|uniref:phage major capsid protein n=1 Tax=uncultured Treponema sp. TaxID=162155 RepID=UPI0025E6900A|nr:phage major capsid protein [uncultured Treponema sp.]